LKKIMSPSTPSNHDWPPLRVLCVIANPSDLSRFDDNGVWQEMAAALEPLTARGSIVLERLAEPTEAALRKSLAQNQWHVVHLVIHGEERPAANYGTIALNSSDGYARQLTAPYVAGLFSASSSIRMVVLQAADQASCGFQIVANTLGTQVPAVVTAPPLSRSNTQIFVSKLYSSVLAGLNADAISKEVLAALPPQVGRENAIRIISRDGSKPILAVENALAAVAASPGLPAERLPVEGLPLEGKSSSVPASPPWQEELRRKRRSGKFDVFLCHHTTDKPAVKRIAQSLKEAGILPWLDVWELPPGLPWQPELERQIGSITSAAVFIGSTGFGPWQEQEINAFLRAFVKRKIPVIPVMLADAPSQPDLPAFLDGMTWVDFRNSDPDPMTMLIWGITGDRPTD
jgi:hypothetical protein